jgi:hypothetical protein
MSARGREGLAARIRQLRGTLPPPGANAEQGRPAETDPARIAALETRIGDLEKMVQGLQDAVYREAQRHDRRLSELEARVEPTALAIALSRDARERGL